MHAANKVDAHEGAAFHHESAAHHHKQAAVHANDGNLSRAERHTAMADDHARAAQDHHGDAQQHGHDWRDAERDEERLFAANPTRDRDDHGGHSMDAPRGMTDLRPNEGGRRPARAGENDGRGDGAADRDRNYSSPTRGGSWFDGTRGGRDRDRGDGHGYGSRSHDDGSSDGRQASSDRDRDGGRSSSRSGSSEGSSDRDRGRAGPSNASGPSADRERGMSEPERSQSDREPRVTDGHNHEPRVDRDRSVENAGQR